MIEIGIVVPAYNRKVFLHEAIDSILTQELPTNWDFHIVVVDDGSTDGTFEDLCSTFGKAMPSVNEISLHPQLTALRKKNAERGAARNYGVQWLIRNRQPHWLCFFDADDIMSRQNLYRFAKRIESAKGQFFGAAYSPIHVWYEGAPLAWGNSHRALPEGDLAELMLRRHILPLGGTLIDTQIFLKLGGFSENRLMSGSEDWALLCRLGLTTPVIYSQHYSVNYRQHPENTNPRNYLKSLDLAVEAILPVVEQRFADRRRWAIKQLIRQATLIKIGAVNSRGLWTDALRIFGREVESDVLFLMDWRAQRISLSILKRALLNFKETLHPRDK